MRRRDVRFIRLIGDDVIAKIEETKPDEFKELVISSIKREKQEMEAREVSYSAWLNAVIIFLRTAFAEDGKKGKLNES